MGGNPRAGRQHVARPSPLQQEVQTRPLSSAPPTSGLVRDPLFWKRFSVAVHMAEVPLDEEAGTAKGSVKSGSTVELKPISNRDDWLVQQHREKRRCRTICISITALLVILITAGAVCGWYFTHHKVSL